MKSRNTLALLLVTALLAGFLWVTRETPADRRAGPAPGQTVFDTPSWDIRELIVERGGQRIEARRGADGWFLARPVQARVSESAMDRVLDTLERMRVGEAIPAREWAARQLSLEEYGLSNPTMRLTIRDRENRTRELLVGRAAPLGHRLYVRFADSEDVLATSCDFTNALPTGPEALRDRRILAGDPGKVVRLEIRRADRGFIQLVRSPGGWRLQQPVAARAHDGRVKSLLEGLLGLEAAEFVWDRPPEDTDSVIREGVALEARMAPYGLTADAAMRVGVWFSGQEMGRDVFLGKPAREDGTRIYARVEGSASVFAVPSGILKLLSGEANDLRDRRLFALWKSEVRQIRFQRKEERLVLAMGEKGGWRVVEPVQWEADPAIVDGVLSAVLRWQTLSFSEATGTNDWAGRGLAAPAFGVVVSAEPYRASLRDGPGPTSDPPVTPLGAVLCVGQWNETSKTVFARFEDGQTVYELPLQDVVALGASPADPLAYRIRQVLTLDPETVVRITAAREGIKQVVERDADGKWRGVVPAGRVVDTEVLCDVLFLAANLRAARIESYNPANAAAFGMAEPYVTLTFGLSGEEGIQKSLVLGQKAVGGRYAMVRGQDVVFVIESEAAERLVRRLVRSRAP
jgi:hypothetical protein